MSRLMLVVLVVSAVLSACTGAAEPTLVPEMGSTEFVQALAGAGLEPEEAGAVDQPFFGVPGVIVRVGDFDLQVFQYPDEASRRADSDGISPDGTSIGTTMVTWIETPTFWAQGRLIVLGFGLDPAVAGAISQILGSPVAGG